MYDVSTHALSAVRAAVASFKPTRLDQPCKDAHNHATYRYEGAPSWAAVASERGRMTASIAESRRHSSPECGEQRPSKNIVRIISILLWYFPNRPGAAGWLHLATYRHECACVMCILLAVHLGLCSRGVSPSFSGGFCWADAECALVSPAAPPPVALRLSSVRLLLTGPFHWPHR